MKPLNDLMCPCDTGTQSAQPVEASQDTAPDPQTSRRYLAAIAMGLTAWFLLYWQLLPFSRFLTFAVFGLDPQSHPGKTVQFFIYDTPKVLLLLGLVIFGVGIVRSFFTPERARRILAGKGESVGNVLAAMLGVVTPFCSCSAVPLFIGFVTAGVPLGVTFSFLVAAPMVNEIALVLLYGLLGWKIAVLYLITGLTVAILAGWTIGRLKMERFIEPWVLKSLASTRATPAGHSTWEHRIRYGLEATKDIVGKVWIYVVLGIAIGAGIHGYVPEGFMAQTMGKDAWWSVPVAVVIGIPMYANAAGIVPIIHALLEKGAALGTVLAFMMSVIALSLPETVILRKVLKPGLIITFISVVGTGILLVGWLFNLII